MRIVLGALSAAVALLLVACSDGGDSDEPDQSTPGGVTATFDQGSIRQDIEFLDTGLLKGHSYADAADEWTVEGVNVEAELDDGTTWGVIEIPEEGDADYITFFEVQVGELPRGEQVTVRTTAFFIDTDGSTTEQTVADTWPP